VSSSRQVGPAEAGRLHRSTLLAAPPTTFGNAIYNSLTYSDVATTGEVVAVLVLAAGFSLSFCWLVVGHMAEICLLGDFDHAAELQWVPYYTITHFHQFPFWDPYKCGGLPMFANPQASIFTPLFLLELILGPTVAVHVEIIAHLAAGWAGSYVLARVIGINRLGAAACATAFGSSSWYFAHLGAGHFEYMDYTDIPWVATFYWLSLERRRPIFAAIGGLLIALMLIEGGIYPVPHAVLMLGILAVALALIRRSVQPIVTMVVMGVFSFGFAAVKLLPMAQMVGAAGRWVDPFETNSFAAFMVEFFSRDQFNGGGVPGGFWGFQEYAAYLGPIVAGLLIFGAMVCWRQALPWIIVAISLLVVAAGDYGAYSPWLLLHHFPPFSSQHAPTRVLIVFTMVAGILVGFGADAISSKAGGLGALAVVALILAIGIDGWLVNGADLQLLYQGGHVGYMPPKEFRQVWKKTNGALEGLMYVTAIANMGALNCYEPAFGGPTAAVGFNQPAYRGEQYLLGKGTVKLVKWTPNVLTYDVDAAEPTKLVLNQNYNQLWGLQQGDGEIISQNGLLAVNVSAGRQRVVLAVHSNRVLVGLAMTLATFVALLALWRFEPLIPWMYLGLGK